MPQSVAEPADEPQAVLHATCANCGGEIMRLSLESAKWRHGNRAVTCAPPAAVDGEAGPVGWFAGRDEPPFDDLVKGDQA